MTTFNFWFAKHIFPG